MPGPETRARSGAAVGAVRTLIHWPGAPGSSASPLRATVKPGPATAIDTASPRNTTGAAAAVCSPTAPETRTNTRQPGISGHSTRTLSRRVPY